MKTNLKVTKITVEEMLLRPEKAYNPSIWEKRVKDYAAYPKCQFYVIEKDGTKNYDYARFFCSYIADGLYFFSDFSAFSSGISNNGFCKVSILENGDVIKTLFKDSTGKEGYAENCPKNRDSFRKTLTPYNVMISNNI